PATEPEQLRLTPGELPDRVLHRHVGAVAYVAGEQQRAVTRGAEHLEVRAGVAGPDQRGRMGEMAGDTGRVVVPDHDHDTGVTVVGQHEVGEHVGEVIAGTRRGEVGERPA